MRPNGLSAVMSATSDRRLRRWSPRRTNWFCALRAARDLVRTDVFLRGFLRAMIVSSIRELGTAGDRFLPLTNLLDVNAAQRPLFPVERCQRPNAEKIPRVQDRHYCFNERSTTSLNWAVLVFLRSSEVTFFVFVRLRGKRIAARCAKPRTISVWSPCHPDWTFPDRRHRQRRGAHVNGACGSGL